MKKRLIARSADTRVRILNAAEALFAHNGLDATSMRAITADAAVNLAAVNYHFGSKEGLIVAVYARRLGPVNQERLAMLETAERRSGGPRLEDVLASYIAPVMRLIQDDQRGGEVFMRLLGRALYEPGDYLAQLFREEMEPILNRFTAALQKCLPFLSAEELFWRMHFGGGALAYTLAQIHRLELLSKGACDPKDVNSVIERLVQFIATGMRGIPAGATRGRPRSIKKAKELSEQLRGKNHP
jgi:AcrR family transcriptional regulator